MARRTQATVELHEVPLKTRFRKLTTDKKAKVRQRAKVEVVPLGDNRFGVTIRRGVVTLKKGVVQMAQGTAAKVRTQIRRDIKAGHYDGALFEDYQKILAAKKRKAAKAS